MKKSIIVVLVLASVLAACGPDKAKLHAELQSIDAEVVQLSIAAQQYRAQMSEAEFDAFIGSFAAGYGSVSGDYGLASDGAGTAYEATAQASAADYSLDQIRRRFESLSKRRAEVLKDLD